MASNTDHKDKREYLKNLLFSFTDKQKNYNRIDNIVTSECASYCLSNFKSDKIDTQENVCLSNCYAKFYDALEIGEICYDKISKREVDYNLLANGKFSEIIDKI